MKNSLISVIWCYLFLSLGSLGAASVFVTNQLGSSVSVINSLDNTVIAVIPVDAFPTGIAITPNGAFVYVTHYNDSSVSVIDASTYAVIASIEVGSSPGSVAITPNGAFAYVVNRSDSSVSVIDTSTNVVIDTILDVAPMGADPFGIAITPNGLYAYVANYNDNSVSVIDTSTNAVIDTIPVNNNIPNHVAITPNGSFAYVTQSFDNLASVINTSTNAETQTITVGISGSGGGGFGVAVTPNGSFVYVVNRFTIRIIDTGTNLVTNTVNLGANAGINVAFTPDGASAYVTLTSANTIKVINTSTLAVSTITDPSFNFTYGVAITDVPTVSSVSPNTGSIAGGTSVTITGTNFTGATAVSFGGTAGTIVSVDSSTQITATSPMHIAGTVDVTVTNPYGTSAINSPADQFTFVDPPTVTSVTPNTGPIASGTSVTIMGTHFTNATAVSFGGTAGTIVSVDSSTQITATSPMHIAGAVDVTVTTPYGTSAINSPSDQFTFVAPPSVSSVSPNSGPTSGGTSVTITGTDFSGASVVNFGPHAGSITSVSSTQIIATSPAGSAGPVDVTVTTPYGTSTPNPPADQFTFVAPPTVTGVTPNAGSTTGGTSVTITGTNFTGTAVSFGGTAASFVVDSSTQITAISPIHGAGTVDVTVTTSGGTSVTSSSDEFTFVTPNPTVTIQPPSNLHGKQIKNKFISQTDIFNVIRWNAPKGGSSPVSYLVYRDNITNLIAQVEANHPLKFKDHNRLKNKVYTYYVVSVDARGQSSAPISVSVEPRP